MTTVSFLKTLIQIADDFFSHLARWTERCDFTRNKLSKRHIFQNVFYSFELSICLLWSNFQ